MIVAKWENECTSLGACACSVCFATQIHFCREKTEQANAPWTSVAKSAKLFQEAQPKKCPSLSVVVCDGKQINRILRLKLGVSLVVQANVKVTADRQDYYIGITNREWLFGSNWWAKVDRGQLWSDRNPSRTQLRFFTATMYSRPNFFSQILTISTHMHLLTVLSVAPIQCSAMTEYFKGLSLADHMCCLLQRSGRMDHTPQPKQWLRVEWCPL